MANVYSNVLVINGAIQHKRGTKAALENSEYVPRSGELLVATDTGDIRVGDGTHSWAELPSPNNDILSRISALEALNGIDCGEITAP